MQSSLYEINNIDNLIVNHITRYLEEKLWKRAGFESDCHWLVEKSSYAERCELAFGTLNATTRDYARFGWLYVNKGLSPLDGSRLIDEKWINESVTSTKLHLKPKYPDKFGYGMQYWTLGNENEPEECHGDYMAIGVYGQFIYVDPVNKIVIARNSANPHYNEEADPVTKSNVGETQAVAAYRAIVKHLVK